MNLTNSFLKPNNTKSKSISTIAVSHKKTIALIGNPNVGKSTIFNALTGLKQHTGNWAGKTVATASGEFNTDKYEYVLVDLPGTYSLTSSSIEEEFARNFVCFEQPDAVIIVCDATCLERNLNLVLQTMEISKNIIVCVNLMDEAKRKGISIDLIKLSNLLGVKVIGITAKSKNSLSKLVTCLDGIIDIQTSISIIKTQYSNSIETAITLIEPFARKIASDKIDNRWFSIKLLESDISFLNTIGKFLGINIENELQHANSNIKEQISKSFETLIVSNTLERASNISKEVVIFKKTNSSELDRKIDRILTGKWTAYPVMLALLLLIFWITITGANYPSKILSDILFSFQDNLTDFFYLLSAPTWLHDMLILGVYRTLAWVVSVMFPPMAIFFPLFTLLEDLGYLPRIAFNLDKHFKKCCACGKQSLTMLTGFGCNAAGVVGCRIISSPRERLIAIITNNFVPCNGRFPILISIITMFFVGFGSGIKERLLSSLLLALIIIFGVITTLIVSFCLSKTILKGLPSSFILELPPYRVPQIRKVIIRSIFDRTLFVLGRAAVVAAPAGLIIWLLSNTVIQEISLLQHFSTFLNPFAKSIGMDGVILMAFILGLPANEIVIPIIIMTYLSQGNITEIESLQSLKSILIINGWTWITAVSTMIFTLTHWPCSTTLLTIKKETGTWKWTFISLLIPTVLGFSACFIFTFFARLLYPLIQ